MMVVVFAAPSSMMAQLTKGKPSADVIRTGNRAKAGDFGFFFGFYNSDVESLFGAFDRQYSFKRTPIPLVNLKYMASDNLELRVGIEIKKSTLAAKIGDRAGGVADGFMETEQGVLTSVDNLLAPGFAYHFSKSNVLDVYFGAELPIGYTRDREYYKYVVEGDEGYDKATSMAWNVGLSGFIGVQAYIANLPLAVGMEWGIFGRYNLNNKSKYESKAIGNSDVIYKYDLNDADLRGLFGGVYDEVKSARKFIAGNQLRFTVTYFFNK